MVISDLTHENFLVALTDAYDYAGIMHRDVSLGNIIVDRKTGTGYLIDWETSCPAETRSLSRTYRRAVSLRASLYTIC